MEPARLTRATSKPAKSKSAQAIRQLREELGSVRSCALLMAHAPAADVRSRYLKTLNKRIASMDGQLAILEQKTQSAS